MRAGRLRHRVRVQTQGSTGQNALGEPSEEWTTLATRSMSVEPLTGREFFEAAQIDAHLTHRFRSRYDTTVSAITPEGRLVLDNSTGRVFDIDSVRNVEERNRELEFMATERV